jgi:hypothetical protein
MSQVRLMHTVQLGESSHSDGVNAPPTATSSCRYPDHILEMSRQYRNHSLTDATAFYPLWRLVLAYWFPASQGYSLTENFDMQWSNINVLFRGQPFLLLQIHGVTDIHSEVTQRTLKERANNIFDRGALWSGHPVLCVISAIGMRWNGFIRSTDTYRTSEQAQQVLLDDWLGGWSENVSSQGSHEALSLFFGLLKSSCTSFVLFASSLLNTRQCNISNKNGCLYVDSSFKFKHHDCTV